MVYIKAVKFENRKQNSTEELQSIFLSYSHYWNLYDEAQVPIFRIFKITCLNLHQWENINNDFMKLKRWETVMRTPQK